MVATRPPKCLHVTPWAVSWIAAKTSVMPQNTATSSQVLSAKLKNCSVSRPTSFQCSAKIAPMQAKAASVIRVNHQVNTNRIRCSSQTRKLSGLKAGNLMNARSAHFFFAFRASRRSSADCCMSAMFFSRGVLYQNSMDSKSSATSCTSSSEMGFPVSLVYASATCSKLRWPLKKRTNSQV